MASMDPKRLPFKGPAEDGISQFAHLVDLLRDPVVLALVAAALALGWMVRGGVQGSSNAVMVIAAPAAPAGR